MRENNEITSIFNRQGKDHIVALLEYVISLRARYLCHSKSQSSHNNLLPRKQRTYKIPGGLHPNTRHTNVNHVTVWFLLFFFSRWALTIHAFSAKIWHERKLFLLLFPSNSAALSRLPKSPAIQSSLFIFPDPHPHLFFPSYFALSVHHRPFWFCNIWGALPDRCKFSQKFIMATRIGQNSWRDLRVDGMKMNRSRFQQELKLPESAAGYRIR